MPRKGLNKEAIIDASIELIEEEGNRAFSLNELARRIGIKPASLYNHIENMEELIGEIGYRIAGMIKKTELDAIADKHRDEALFALCDAYRAFAREHMDLYKVIMGMQKDKHACTEAAHSELIEPIMQMLSDYRIGESEKIHWQRILRATMHGFVAHEYAGGFRHFSAEYDDTYHKAVGVVALGLHSEESEEGL